MKRMICIAGLAGLLLMAVNAQGQNYQSVLKQNIELKKKVSDLGGQIKNRDTTIKRLQGLLTERKAEISELKEKLRVAGVLLEESVEKDKNIQVPAEVLKKALLKDLGVSRRKEIKRVWGVNYFLIPGNRIKTCLSIDWSLNYKSRYHNEAIKIIKTVTSLTGRFDYLILRATAASADRSGHITEIIAEGPMILKKEDIVKINWSSFYQSKIADISKIDEKDRQTIGGIMRSDPKLKLLPTNK